MSLETMLACIPYVRWHGLAPKDAPDGRVELGMPLRAELTNHVGIAHAGALFTLAETAAGVAAWRVVPGDRAFVLLRGASVRYLRRAEGDLVAAASVEPDRASEARAAFETDARADVGATVRVVDGTGAAVFEGAFDYALRPRPGAGP